VRFTDYRQPGAAKCAVERQGIELECDIRRNRSIGTEPASRGLRFVLTALVRASRTVLSIGVGRGPYIEFQKDCLFGVLIPSRNTGPRSRRCCGDRTKKGEIERPQSIIKQPQGAQFGRHCERIDRDQLALSTVHQWRYWPYRGEPTDDRNGQIGYAAHGASLCHIVATRGHPARCRG